MKAGWGEKPFNVDLSPKRDFNKSNWNEDIAFVQKQVKSLWIILSFRAYMLQLSELDDGAEVRDVFMLGFLNISITTVALEISDPFFK